MHCINGLSGFPLLCKFKSDRLLIHELQITRTPQTYMLLLLLFAQTQTLVMYVEKGFLVVNWMIKNCKLPE